MKTPAVSPSEEAPPPVPHPLPSSGGTYTVENGDLIPEAGPETPPQKER